MHRSRSTLPRREYVYIVSRRKESNARRGGSGFSFRRVALRRVVRCARERKVVSAVNISLYRREPIANHAYRWRQRLLLDSAVTSCACRWRHLRVPNDDEERGIELDISQNISMTIPESTSLRSHCLYGVSWNNKKTKQIIRERDTYHDLPSLDPRRVLIARIDIFIAQKASNFCHNKLAFLHQSLIFTCLFMTPVFLSLLVISPVFCSYFCCV